MNVTPILAATQPGGTTLTGIDWIAIALYFTVLLVVAWKAITKEKDTAADYFLAGRNLSWWIIGASIFASNIGSEHIVGLAGSGAKDGVAMAHYELHAWCLLVLAWVFVPFYARSLVFTMPEFLERRFCTNSRYVLSIVSLVTFIVSKIAVGIFAGGVVFGTLLPELHIQIGSLNIDSFWIGSVLVIALTGLYTMLGGMRAVAYNDVVQVIVLITGSAMLTIYGLIQLGGWGELKRLCGSEMFNLWKPLIPAGMDGTWAPVKEPTRIAWYFNTNFPWLGMAICAPVIGLWYWCTDQYIVQRALGAPNEAVARRGSIFAAFLKLFPVYLFRPRQERKNPRPRSGVRPRHRPGDRPGTGSLPVAGAAFAPARAARHRGRRSALRPHGFAGGRVQRLLDALHGGHLREAAPESHPG
jgi:SSS family solute:Na+ symporter